MMEATAKRRAQIEKAAIETPVSLLKWTSYLSVSLASQNPLNANTLKPSMRRAKQHKSWN